MLRHERDAGASSTDRARSGADRPERFRLVIEAALEALCERHELTYDQCALMARLILTANRWSGVVPGTNRYLAERLRMGPKRLARLLNELDAAGVVRREHHQGHDGAVVVVDWPELVRPPGSRRRDASDQGVRDSSRQLDASELGIREKAELTRPFASPRREPDASGRVPPTRATCETHSLLSGSGSSARVPRVAGGTDNDGNRSQPRAVADLVDGDAGSRDDGEDWSCQSCGRREGIRWWRVPDRHDWRHRWGVAVAYCPECEPMHPDDEMTEVAVRPCTACGGPACDMSGRCAACIEVRYLAVAR
jgi:hypothetical protein